MIRISKVYNCKNYNSTQMLLHHVKMPYCFISLAREGLEDQASLLFSLRRRGVRMTPTRRRGGGSQPYEETYGQGGSVWLDVMDNRIPLPRNHS